MDNLNLHYQQDLIINLAKDKIFIFCFVEYTTHWAQPLDSTPFANWKANLASLTMSHDWSDVLLRDQDRNNTYKTLIESIYKSFSPQDIKNAF